MFTRALRLHVQPGKMEDAVRIFRDAVLPAAKKQPGFRGGLLLTNAATGQALSVGFWETEAAMTASETSGYLEKQLARFEELFVARPEQESYQVSVQLL